MLSGVSVKQEVSDVQHEGGGENASSGKNGGVLFGGVAFLSPPSTVDPDAPRQQGENAVVKGTDQLPKSTPTIIIVTSQELEEATLAYLAKKSKKPTAYTIFSNILRPKILSETPGIDPLGGCGRLLGQKWGTIDREERDRYDRVIVKACEDYQAAHPDKTIGRSNETTKRGPRSKKQQKSSSQTTSKKMNEIKTTAVKEKEADSTNAMDVKSFLTIKDLQPMDVVFSGVLQHESGKKAFRDFLDNLHSIKASILESHSSEALAKYCLSSYKGRFWEPAGPSHPKMIRPMTNEKCLPLLEVRVAAWMKSKGIPVTPPRVVTPVNGLQSTLVPPSAAPAATREEGPQEESSIPAAEPEAKEEPMEKLKLCLRKVNMPKPKKTSSRPSCSSTDSGASAVASSKQVPLKQHTHLNTTKKRGSSSLPFYVPAKPTNKRNKAKGATYSQSDTVEVIDLTMD